MSTRARRYWALATAPNMSGAPATPSARKWPIRAPAVNSTTPASNATKRAIDRFGSRNTSATIGASTTTNGRIPSRKVRICSPFFAASIAAHSTTVNLASSDGCTVTKPRVTQRRAPLIVGEMAWVNGSSGTSSSSAVAPSSGQAARRHLR